MIVIKLIILILKAKTFLLIFIKTIKGPKVIELDDTFLKYIKPGLDNYLISIKNGELYTTSSSFEKFFINTFSYNVYDLRKAISFKIIAKGITRKLKKVRIYSRPLDRSRLESL